MRVITAASTGANASGATNPTAVSATPSGGAEPRKAAPSPRNTRDGIRLVSKNATTARPNTFSLKLRVSSQERQNASNELASSSRTTTAVVRPYLQATYMINQQPPTTSATVKSAPAHRNSIAPTPATTPTPSVISMSTMPLPNPTAVSGHSLDQPSDSASRRRGSRPRYESEMTRIVPALSTKLAT